MKKSFVLITACIFAIACGNSETSKTESTQTETVPTENAAIPAKNDNGTSPCGFVSEAKIKEVLALPADAITEMKDVMRTYPTCFYEWDTVAYTTSQTIGGKEINLDYPAEASIVLVEDANGVMFERSTKVYKDGESQNGIGDMAIWGSKMSQLTFLAKGTMIHLRVRVTKDAAANKEKAVALAALIIDKL